MKKLLVLALALLMVIGAASVSMAAGTVSLDAFTGDEAKTYSQNFDISQVTLGFDVPIEKFKIAGSFSTGTINEIPDVDTTCFMLKGGFAIINDKNLRLDITGGYYKRVSDYYDEFDGGFIDFDRSLTSLLIGLDSKFTLQDNMWFELNLGIGMDAELEITDHPTDDVTKTNLIDSLTTLNLKFNYLFTKQFGGALGYSWEKWEGSDTYKETFSGLTAGVFFKF